MKKKRRPEEEDKVLQFAIIAVIVLLLAGGGIIGIRATNLRVDSTEGEEKLSELGKADIDAVEARIQELEQAEFDANAEEESRSNNEKFANCLILGDSITQGLYEFGLLDEALVIAERGVGVKETQESGLSGMLNQAAAAAPQKIFFAVGMNDIESENGDADAFAEDYRKMLDTAGKLLPNAEIYVNSILPAHQTLIEREEWYANVPEYNQKLEELCNEKAVIFIDNTELVEENFYSNDGIHMSPKYYPKWIKHMAEEAKL